MPGAEAGLGCGLKILTMYVETSALPCQMVSTMHNRSGIILRLTHIWLQAALITAGVALLPVAPTEGVHGRAVDGSYCFWTFGP